LEATREPIAPRHREQQRRLFTSRIRLLQPPGLCISRADASIKNSQPLIIITPPPPSHSFIQTRQPSSHGPSQNQTTWVCCESPVPSGHRPCDAASLTALTPGSRALGTALEWPEAKKRADQVREWGIKVCCSDVIHPSILCPFVLTGLSNQQLLEIWNKAKGKERDALLWGDEVTLSQSHAIPSLSQQLIHSRSSTLSSRIPRTKKRSCCLCDRPKSWRHWLPTRNWPKKAAFLPCKTALFTSPSE
jgi:hypothetical protein